MAAKRDYFRQFDVAYADRRPAIVHKSSGESVRAGKLHKARGVKIHAKIEEHIKNTYLKHVDASVGVKAALRCGMELNED